MFPLDYHYSREVAVGLEKEHVSAIKTLPLFIIIFQGKRKKIYSTKTPMAREVNEIAQKQINAI